MPCRSKVMPEHNVRCTTIEHSHRSYRGDSIPNVHGCMHVHSEWKSNLVPKMAACCVGCKAVFMSWCHEVPCECIEGKVVSSAYSS